eukprot:XP_001710168.1 Hypothetical protein GL50803_24840 [Giardia lamblia ATCC 50803]
MEGQCTKKREYSAGRGLTEVKDFLNRADIHDDPQLNVASQHDS